MPNTPEDIVRKTNEKSSRRERDAKILEMRKQGYTQTEIAATLGIANHSTISRAITRALKEITREPSEELLELELLRLDELVKTAHQQLGTGNRLYAIDRLLKILDRRAKLLGLYKESPNEEIDQTTMVFQAAHAAARVALNNPNLSADDIALQIAKDT